MASLRKLHLYLGCFFAPMLLFFSISGIWQTFGWDRNVRFLQLLSTIHRGHGRKNLSMSLTSFPMELFVTVMALGLILSIITGVALAFRFGRGWVALASVAGGIVIPLWLILLSR